MLVGVESCLSLSCTKIPESEIVLDVRGMRVIMTEMLQKKRKSDCFVFMCVCACARTHVCGRSLYLDISHHLSRKHGGQVFF